MWQRSVCGNFHLIYKPNLQNLLWKFSSFRQNLTNFLLFNLKFHNQTDNNVYPEWGLFTKSGLNCRIKGYMRCFSDLILLVFKDVQPEPNNIHRAGGTGIIGRRLLAIKFLRILKTWTDYCEDRAKSFPRLNFLFSQSKQNNPTDWKFTKV